MRRLVALLAVGALAGCGGGGDEGAATSTAREADAEVEREAGVERPPGASRPPATILRTGVVQIEAFDCRGELYEGTGFHVGGDVVVTAAHVIEGGHDVAVARTGRRMYPAVVLAVDQRMDVAVLETGQRMTGHAFAVAERGARFDDPVLVLSEPGRGRAVRPGRVRAVDTAQYVDGEV
ncbi:MAG TPA: serine protease, partial [Capillimicrobium sp.]